MSTTTTRTTLDQFFAALPLDTEQAKRGTTLSTKLKTKITKYAGKQELTRLLPLMETLTPLLRQHPTKIDVIAAILTSDSTLDAQRITRRINGSELPPSANHYTHHTGDPEQLATLLVSGTEPITDLNWKPVTPEQITREIARLTLPDISLLTYALQSHWVTTNQAWDTLTRSSEDSNIIPECLLLASKLTDLNYRDTTLVHVVRGMRHAHEEHGIRNVLDPLDLSTDEKLNHNAAIARATILAAGEDSRYNTHPDRRLIRNRRTNQQTMHGIQLNEQAVNLYHWYPNHHQQITQLLIADGNSIMRTDELLQAHIQ